MRMAKFTSPPAAAIATRADCSSKPSSNNLSIGKYVLLPFLFGKSLSGGPALPTDLVAATLRANIVPPDSARELAACKDVLPHDNLRLEGANVLARTVAAAAAG
mmetsp:Transcript_58614/g.168304  ORF Transcript_58614/g.168304 Transcript_58614/m.168304 type:complete len:104 (-) Transcript_58614:378-689(-)